MSKPTEAEASALASLFPGQKPMKPFNPRSPCVASANMKKKKAAIKPINKDSHVSVMMMKEFSPKLPKGAARLEMIAEGRLQSVRIGRLMTPEEVKAKLCEAFSVTDYTVLHCDGVSKYLMKCNDQNIDGIAAIERRGCLYLCESMQVCLKHFIRWVTHNCNNYALSTKFVPTDFCLPYPIVVQIQGTELQLLLLNLGYSVKILSLSFTDSI